MSEVVVAFIADLDARGRICPMPRPWNALRSALAGAAHGHAQVDRLPVPLILDGWHHSSDFEKRDRFRAQLRWAEDCGVWEVAARFVGLISDQDWYTGD